MGLLCLIFPYVFFALNLFSPTNFINKEKQNSSIKTDMIGVHSLCVETPDPPKPPPPS